MAGNHLVLIPELGCSGLAWMLWEKKILGGVGPCVFTSLMCLVLPESRFSDPNHIKKVFEFSFFQISLYGDLGWGWAFKHFSFIFVLSNPCDSREGVIYLGGGKSWCICKLKPSRKPGRWLLAWMA